MKKKMERIKLDGAVLNEDFVIVSKFVILTDDWLIYPYEEGMDLQNVTCDVAETMFPENIIEYVYDVGPTIDIPLAVTLGLGVIKSNFDGSLSLYHVDNIDDEDRIKKEMLRLAMYYQIMNPDYDDRILNYLLDRELGEFYLKMLLFCDTIEPIERLREIFAAKKGRGDNVVQFRRNE